MNIEYTIKKSDNKELFNTLYNAMQVLDKNQYQPSRKYVRVNNGIMAVTNGRVLFTITVNANDGFYLPVSVTKQRIVLEPVELDDSQYPNTDAICNADYTCGYSAGYEANFQKETHASHLTARIAADTGILFDSDLVSLIHNAGALYMSYIPDEKTRAASQFEGLNFKAYLMPIAELN